MTAMTLPDWLLLLSALLAVAVLLGIVAQRTRLPLTVVLAAIGFLTGALTNIQSPLQGERFEEVLVFLFLPVLVFEAAFGLSTRSFIRNFVPILVLAIPALAVSAAVVGLALSVGLNIALVPALLFGALISATDPVAVVAIFRDLGVPRRLLTLVEGESLLNDGVAIVLFTILLAAATGQELNVARGIWEFILVFVGGAVIGGLVGLLAAFVLPWLDRLSAAALSLVVAYGGFVLADDVLGFSGVTATVAAGLVLGGSAPIRATEPIRELWEGLWETLGYVANALLFLLIGLAIEPALLIDNAGAIGLAIIAVLASRAVAVIPLVVFLERVAHIPPVGFRNQAVLIWGGLRGGVALALALALPEELAEREQFVAMTGGVVLATLVLNATTIGALVRRLGLDTLSSTDRFLAGGAQLSAIGAARARLADLNLDDAVISEELNRVEQHTYDELSGIRLSADDEVRIVTQRGLVVERETYQHLSDAGLLPPVAARTLLHEVDDQIEEMGVDQSTQESMRQRRPNGFDRWVAQATARLPSPVGEEPSTLAYAEASARRLAARRTVEALSLFSRLPNVSSDTIDRAQHMFAQWEEKAIRELETLDTDVTHDLGAVRHRQAETLVRIAATDALEQLAEMGLLPKTIAERAGEAVAEEATKA